MFKKMFLQIALLALGAVWLAGCGMYEYQAKFQVGQPIDQREPVQYVGPDGKVRNKPAVAPTMDLGAAGDVRFGQRSFVAGGAITNPQRQVQYFEERIIKETTKGDTRDCPLEEQITEMRNNEVNRTETYRSAKTLPEEAVPLPVYGNADDGPGTKLFGKALDAGGSFATGGLYGLLRKSDQTNVTQVGGTQVGGGAAAYGGDAKAQAQTGDANANSVAIGKGDYKATNIGVHNEYQKQK